MGRFRLLAAELGGCDSELTLELGVEVTQMPGADGLDDLRDGGVGFQQQLPRAPETQFVLTRAQGDAEMLLEQAVEVGQTAAATRRKGGGRKFTQLRLGKLIRQLLKPLAGGQNDALFRFRRLRVPLQSFGRDLQQASATP